MESFEITINEEPFRIIRSGMDNTIFSVFNHAACHIIKKNENDTWSRVEHRFGVEIIPLKEIGKAIDHYYKSWQLSVGEMPKAKRA